MVWGQSFSQNSFALLERAGEQKASQQERGYSPISMPICEDVKGVDG